MVQLGEKKRESFSEEMKKMTRDVPGQLFKQLWKTIVSGDQKFLRQFLIVIKMAKKKKLNGTVVFSQLPSQFNCDDD